MLSQNRKRWGVGGGVWREREREENKGRRSVVLKKKGFETKGVVWGVGFYSSDALRSLYIATDPHSGGCFSVEALSWVGTQKGPCTGHPSACGCNFAEPKSQFLEKGLSQISATPNITPSSVQSP